MLKELFIENIAVIERASIDFSAGFNILTGETGAGKSILIGSINTILGERISRDIVRTGAEKANVTAVFSLPNKRVLKLLEEEGIAYEAGEDLIVSREISVDGRSSCRVLGRPVTVGFLRSIGDALITIHGQHDSRDLFVSHEHLGFVDSYANLASEIAIYREKYEKYHEIMGKLAALQMDEDEKQERIDLLKYQINEIEEAEISADEEAELAAEKLMIKNSFKIVSGLEKARAALFGEEIDGEDIDGAITKLDVAATALEVSAEYYENVKKSSDRIRELYYEIVELANDVSHETAAIDFEPGKIEDIEKRLDILYHIKRKYKGDIAEIILKLEDMKSELSDIELSDELSKKLSADCESLFKEANEMANILSSKREAAAKAFAAEVHTELSDLNMPGLRLSFLHELGEIRPNGKDKLTMLISANPGETPKPVSKIASGGELSRIMLAIKKVLADRDDYETQIFDEIDTGVSGKAAEKIGLKLKSIAGGKQIICVTHLAQIAVLADTHFLIEKTTKQDRTFTDVRRLSEDERAKEIARIIGGEHITELTLENAKEMLLNALDK